MVGLLKAVRDHLAARRFLRTPLGQALRDHTQQYFNSGQVLSWMAPEAKERFAQTLLDKLAEIQRSADPLKTLRDEIGGYTIAATRLTVLAQTEEEKQTMPYAANPYISGELHQHIIGAAAFDEELCSFLKERPDADAADLIGFANSRSALMLYFLNGLNMIRRAMGDSDEDHDWFQPMFEAQLVREEDAYRQKLGLPSLLSDPTEADVYGSFLAFVFDRGVPNPLLGWLQIFPGHYLTGYESVGGG